MMQFWFLCGCYSIGMFCGEGGFRLLLCMGVRLFLFLFFQLQCLCGVIGLDRWNSRVLMMLVKVLFMCDCQDMFGLCGRMVSSMLLQNRKVIRLVVMVGWLWCSRLRMNIRNIRLWVMLLVLRWWLLMLLSSQVFRFELIYSSGNVCRVVLGQMLLVRVLRISRVVVLVFRCWIELCSNGVLRMLSRLVLFSGVIVYGCQLK